MPFRRQKQVPDFWEAGFDGAFQVSHDGLHPRGQLGPSWVKIYRSCNHRRRAEVPPRADVLDNAAIR
jgi:hypothetical protein